MHTTMLFLNMTDGLRTALIKLSAIRLDAQSRYLITHCFLCLGVLLERSNLLYRSITPFKGDSIPKMLRWDLPEGKINATIRNSFSSNNHC